MKRNISVSCRLWGLAESTRLVPVQPCQPSGLPPTKLALKVGMMERNAISCHSYYGPSFGSDDGLRIVTLPNAYNSSVSLNSSYQWPTGQNACIYFAGSQNSQITEMDVFCIWEIKRNKKVKSAYKQSRPSGQSLSRPVFITHEATFNIFTPLWMGCQSIAGLSPALNSPVPNYSPA